jgi:hypothetical protein
MIGEVKVDRQNARDGAGPDQKSSNVPDDFSGRSKFIMPLKPDGADEPDGQKSQGHQTVVETIFAERRTQSGQKRKTIGTKQVGGQMPDHHQAAKSQAGQEKTPEVDQAMILRRKHEVVHAKKTPDGSGTKTRQYHPQQQKYQMIPQVKHQQTNGE